MMSLHLRKAFSLVVLIAAPLAQASAQSVPAESRGSSSIGIQGIANVGAGWPTATRTFDALGLDSNPVEFGGAVQFTNLWRDLFAQVSASRMSTTGERAFVGDDGTAFPLGIPLTVKSTYIDFSGGWKFAPGADDFQRVVSYAGGGVGLVELTERSPFAQPGDDVDESSTSYHVIGGVEVGLVSWLGVSADLRYRWIPDLLGNDGVSEILGEDDFGGFQASVGVRFRFGGGRSHTGPPADTVETSLPVPPSAVQPAESQDSNLTPTVASAPVYLKPDATREPLRILEPGTMVKILQEDGEWIRIEFRDRLLGLRIGFIQKKYLRSPR
jgi:opacity protein-like surface antigen